MRPPCDRWCQAVAASTVPAVGSRPKVNRAIKRALVTEAGGKCANPGCPNTLTELHHIREWHVVRTHDNAHMVALCPACHEAVSRGTLRVTDEDAYRWKTVIRTDQRVRGLLYVEPSPTPPVLLAGTIELAGTEGLVVFNHSGLWELSFGLLGTDIMLMSALVSDTAGAPVFRVRDGHFETIDPDFQGEVVQRPGRFRVTHPLSAALMPDWAVEQVRQHEPDFASSGVLPVLDMHVERPNVVRVCGIWMTKSYGMVITPQGLHFVDETRPSPVTLQGEEKGGSRFEFSGPADSAMFAFAGRVP